MNLQAVTQSFETLHRYAGWLDRERASVRVRATVRALGAALESSGDPWPPLRVLDSDIARLPGDDLRRLLGGAAAQMRRALEDAS